MAKIKFGGAIADARGKLDGVVYSRNQYGAYIRNKVSPVQPQSTAQTIVRENMTQLSKAWATTLTDSERAAWNAFAKVNPVRDIFGASTLMTGINMYNKLNGILLHIGEPRIDTPPADLTVLPLLTMTAAAAAGAGTLAITFTDTPIGAADRLQVWATQGLTAGRAFFKPYLRCIGYSAAAQVSPFAAGTLYTTRFGAMTAGAVIGVVVAVCDEATGAVSTGIFRRVVVGA